VSGRVLVRLGTFASVTDRGDITGAAGSSPDGLFQRDARHLSRWRLTAGDAPLTLLTAAGDGCVLTPPGTRDEPPAFTVLRTQAVAPGAFSERIRVVGNAAGPTTVVLELTVDADFADQFELRADHRAYAKAGAERSVVPLPDGAEFRYRRDAAWSAATTVTASPAPGEIRPAPGEATAHVLVWRLDLPEHGSADIVLTARAFAPGAPEPATPASPAAAVEDRDRAGARFTGARPLPGELTTWPELARACETGLRDLAGLLVPARGPDGEELLVPGAGVPWFLTLFGRDSLLTALFALPHRPALAAAVLPALAAVQGERHAPARLEQPGRIVHEIRHGELAHFGQVPYGRYYGSVDATPLFLVLLGAHAAATGDASLARRLEPHARAAVEWMFRDGGLDGSGYLTYTSDAAAGGLVNQNWKDSPGSVCFADGTAATGPIAVAEAQGYAYDALLRTARLAREVWDDTAYAARLESAAADLRERFHRDFWMPGPDFPAMALDGEGRRADALGSNAGHLLWSGILDDALAARVGRRLLEPDFFSGWGVRTLARGQRPYHPLSYHRGAIWPHDNAVIALGLARHGLAAEAREVARALLDAARHHDWRLPEVMSGYSRDQYPTPVPYPHSCSPQAWAAATPLALLTAVEGEAGAG
jgi:glycogen debranching enzyme